MEFTGSKAFLNIPVAAARDKKLLKYPKSIILLGEIVSMLNVTGEFFMSNSTLAKRLNCEPRTIINYVNLLEEEGYISKKIVRDTENGAIKGRIISAGDTLVKSASLGWCPTFHQGSEQEFTGVVKQRSPKKNKLKEHHNRSLNKSLSKEEKQRDANVIKILINYLNHCAEEWRRPIITFSDSEINKMIRAVHGKDTRKLKEAAEKTVVYGEQYPQGYLLTCIKNLPKEEVANEE